MKTLVIAPALCLVIALLPCAVFAAHTKRYETVSVCSVLQNPSSYARKKVSIHGSVYMGMENTNISDRKCPGKGIELKVGDDVYEHADIRSFHRKIAGWQMHGFATVSGTFTVTDSPLTPFILNVERVSNVAQYDRD